MRDFAMAHIHIYIYLFMYLHIHIYIFDHGKDLPPKYCMIKEHVCELESHWSGSDHGCGFLQTNMERFWQPKIEFSANFLGKMAEFPQGKWWYFPAPKHFYQQTWGCYEIDKATCCHRDSLKVVDSDFKQQDWWLSHDEFQQPTGAIGMVPPE